MILNPQYVTEDKIQVNKDKIINLIKQYTNHKHIVLTNSGDLAIYAAMYYLSKAGYEQLIIPDQGGWLSYKKFPAKMNINIIELKTDKGVVILDELEKVCKEAKEKHKPKKTAFIITSFAGYYAEQPLADISKICKTYNVLLIEDTNAIGDKTTKINKNKLSTKTNKNKLCNSKLSEIIVCSFGKWKVVNNYQGGFISSNDKKVIEIIKSCDNKNNYMSDDHKNSIENEIKPINIDYEKLLGNLETAHERLNFLIETCAQIKKELSEIGVNVFHKDKRGIVVITEYNDKAIDYCKKNNLEYTICPRYIRVNEKAISIEVKRIER